MEATFPTVPRRIRTGGRPFHGKASQHSPVLPRRRGRGGTSVNAEATRQRRKQVKFEDFFKVRRNVIFERARFNRRNQLEGESAEKYIMELYALAENCNYGNMKEEMIRDRLVVGIRDIALLQKLQLDAALTLEKAKRNIRQREALSEQQRILGAPEEMRVDQLHYRNRKYPPRGKRPQTHAPHAHRPDAPIRTETAGSERTGKTCSRCGRGSHPRDKCPAKDAVCHKCGHYSSQCFSKKVSEVTGANET